MLGVEAGLGVDWMKDWALWPPTVNDNVTHDRDCENFLCLFGSVPIVDGGKGKKQNLYKKKA